MADLSCMVQIVDSCVRSAQTSPPGYAVGGFFHAQIRHTKTHSGYLSMEDQLAQAVAAELVSRGCSVARVQTNHGAATLSVAAYGTEITVITNEHGKPVTDAQRKWADQWKGTVVWCNGRDQAAAIADALTGGEFE